MWDQYAATSEQNQQQRSLRDIARKSTELISRYMGNIAALMKTRARIKKAEEGASKRVKSRPGGAAPSISDRSLASQKPRKL